MTTNKITNLVDEIFRALSGNYCRCASTIALDVFGPRYNESDLKSLKRELERLSKAGRLNRVIRFESHAVRNNRFGGSATGRHKAAYYKIHVEPGISVQHVSTTRVM